jgi:hypothetical protein
VGCLVARVFFLFVESFIFFKVVQKKWGQGSAIFATISWLYGVYCVFEGGNFTEEYSLFLSFLSISYFLSLDGSSLKKADKKLSILLGFSLIINFMFRANNIGVPMTILLSALLLQFTRRKYGQVMKTIFFTVLSSVISFLIFYLYFSYQGIFIEMIEASILYNFFYSKAHHAFHLNLWEGLINIGWPAYIATLTYFSIVIQLFRKHSYDFLQPVHILVLFLFPVEVILSSISGRSYLHYFISWMPVIAILSAIAFHDFSKYIFSSRLLGLLNDAKYGLFFPVLGLLMSYIVTGIFQDYKETTRRLMFERSSGVEFHDPLSDFLRENSGKEDTILAWGAYPSINYATRRDAPTPYLFYPAYERSPYTENMALSFVEKIEEAPPFLIVDMYVKAPDYILSVDPIIRNSQIKSEGTLVFENIPYQDSFFNFVEMHYVKIKTFEDIDVYQLILVDE